MKEKAMILLPNEWRTEKWRLVYSYDFRCLQGPMFPMLVSSAILRTPNFKKPFILLYDASLYWLGCALAQENEDGVELPKAYMFEKLSKAQRNSVTELECFAVIKCINKFRVYIEGQDFCVITDHASLHWLMRQKDLSGRLAKWFFRLKGFSFKIKRLLGSENVVADALLRR